MTRLDEHLGRELERAARPADPSGVYEDLIRRRERRRIVRAGGRGLLAFAVVAGSLVGVLFLSKVFGTSEPGTPGGTGRTVEPTPPATEEPEALPGDDVGLGLRLCDVTSVRGTFVDGGADAQTALVGTEPADDECPRAQELTGVAAIDLTGDGVVDVASEPFECEGGCLAYATPDVDGDGTHELLVQNVLFSIAGLRLFDLVPDEDAPALVMPMVEPPGDPAGATQGFDGSAPPQFWIGGDAFIADALRCETRESGRVLISTTAESLPHNAPDAVWKIHETSFVLEDGALRVIGTGDLEEPTEHGPGAAPSFMSTTGCGADLRP